MESAEQGGQSQDVNDGAGEPGVVQHLPLIDQNEGAAPDRSGDSPIFDGDPTDNEEIAAADGDDSLDIPPGVESLSQNLFQDAPVDEFSYGAPLTPVLDVAQNAVEYVPTCPTAKARPTEEEYTLIWDAKLAMHSRSNDMPFAFDNLCPRPNHVLWQDCPYALPVISIM